MKCGDLEEELMNCVVDGWKGGFKRILGRIFNYVLGIICGFIIIVFNDCSRLYRV